MLLCKCGSDRVDVKQWNGARARIRCFTCENEAWLDGFTLSSFEPMKLLVAALVDEARKYRQRSPEETRKLQERRRTG